jgi:prevent-host-death family protein
VTLVIKRRIGMTIVSKSQFKPKTLEYFRKVQETGEPLIITEYGKPVLKIVPYQASADELLKHLRGSVLRYDDPLEPVGLEDWDLLE